MTYKYELTFTESAWKEWRKLDSDTRSKFSKKLKERRQEPCIPASRLFAMRDCYKIKLRSAGYRLVYRVVEAEILIEVISVGKRDKGAVYEAAQERI
jgi:mRNA interferase RelE/StbE